MTLKLVNEIQVLELNVNCQGNQTNEIMCIFPAFYLCHCVLFKVFLKL